MPKATVTYYAPKGDSKVCEVFGHTFFDGQSQEVDLPQAQLDKLANNATFQPPGEGGSVPKSGSGGAQGENKEHHKR